jgi:hypothetical protein
MLHEGDEVQVHILLCRWGRGITLRASSLQGRAAAKLAMILSRGRTYQSRATSRSKQPLRWTLA